MRRTIHYLLLYSPILLSLLARPILVYSTQDFVTFKVEKTERIVDGSEENTRSRYLVFTDKETFENTDELFLGKFNSSDLYGAIKPNKTYRARVTGVREAFFSWYRNILSIEELPTTTQPTINDSPRAIFPKQ
jgi:hypothetical protein